MKNLPEDFARALLDAAKNDTAPAGAKARALAAIGGPIGGAASASSAAGATKATAVAGGAAAWKWLAAAAAIGVVGTGAEVAHRALTKPVEVAHVDPTVASEVTREHASLPPSATPGNVNRENAVAPHPAESAAAKSCRDVSLPDGPPSVCSTRGAPMSLDIVNGCSSERVEVYWVDYNCKEVLYRPLSPGETLHQATYDTHPWRVREAGTHRLLKEIVPTGTPRPADAGASQPVSLPDLVVGEGSRADEGAPRACSVFGEKATIRFKNDRPHDPVDVFWVDYDCHEQFKMRLEAGKDVSQSTFDAHPWRIRDSATGALMADFVPKRADEGPTYVYVP